jgi:hypothetical protein
VKGLPAQLIALVLALVLGAACKSDPSPIAVLTETSAGTEKQIGDAAGWNAAAVGVKFFRGDAVRTADATALLAVGQNAALRVQPRSLIRFGEHDGKDSIDVQLGEATLEGSSGKYQLGLGGIVLDGQSKVRIVAGDGGSQLELMLGKATLEQNGEVTAMEQGKAYQLGLGDLSMVRYDAAPADAAPAVDAAPAIDAAPATPKVSVVITGKKAQHVAKGTKNPVAVPAGSSELDAGELRIGARTSAKASSPGVTLDVGTGARIAIGGEPFMALTMGKASAAGDATTEGKVGVPGGHVVLKPGGKSAGASIDIRNRRETRIVATRGEIDLVGKSDKVTLEHGDTGVINANGTIEIVEQIPKYFDLRVNAGESFTVHDPRPGVAVRFAFECKSGGSIELIKDGVKRMTAGSDGANAMLGAGSWTYRQRCEGSGRVVKTGRIGVRRDDAHRELPKGQPPTNNVTANGKTYTVSYQNLFPNVEFKWPGATGSGFVLHLVKGAKKKSFPADSNATVVVPGTELSEGVSTYFFVNSAGTQSKTSFLNVQFNSAVPSVYIESPKAIAAFAPQIEIKGSTFSGWSVSVDGAAVPVDKHGRFAAQVNAPSANALAIKLSHPRQGVHYYLRRHP